METYKRRASRWLTGVSTSHKKEQDNECFVCREAFDNNTVIQDTLECGHIVCVACHERWLQTCVGNPLKENVPCPTGWCTTLLKKDTARMLQQRKLLRNYLATSFADVYTFYMSLIHLLGIFMNIVLQSMSYSYKILDTCVDLNTGSFIPHKGAFVLFQPNGLATSCSNDIGSGCAVFQTITILLHWISRTWLSTFNFSWRQKCIMGFLIPSLRLCLLAVVVFFEHMNMNLLSLRMALAHFGDMPPIIFSFRFYIGVMMTFLFVLCDLFVWLVHN